MPKITIEVSDTVYSLLEVLLEDGNVEQVVTLLVDHAQQGVYRPGAWEREWIVSAFGPDFMERLERGDPYGRGDEARSGFGIMFQRPRSGRSSNTQN